MHFYIAALARIEDSAWFYILDDSSLIYAGLAFKVLSIQVKSMSVCSDVNSIVNTKLI